MDPAETSPEVQFKRFLYTCSEDLTFVSGDPLHYKRLNPESTKCMSLLLSGSEPEKFIDIIEAVHSENLLVRRESLFFALAYASLNIDDSLKRKTSDTVAVIAKSVKEYFLFLKFISLLNEKLHITTSLRKMFQSLYASKEPLELAEFVTRNSGFYGFKHKDIIKLAHFKPPDQLCDLAITYVMFGLDRARSTVLDTPETQILLDYFVKLDSLKRCVDEQMCADLLKDQQFVLNQVPSVLVKSKIVWEALIPSMTLDELLSNLLRMNKYGFFKQQSFNELLIEKLTDKDFVRDSQIHPIVVFIALKTLEKGGRRVDPKFVSYFETKEAEKLQADSTYVKQKVRTVYPPKCMQILAAIQKTLQLSYKNLKPTRKRIVIFVQPYNKNMEKPCLTSTEVSCLEAAAFLILLVQRIETEEFIVLQCSDTDIKCISTENNTYKSTIQKLKKIKGEFMLPFDGMDFYEEGKISDVDLFINILACNSTYFNAPKKLRDKSCSELLNQYKQKRGYDKTRVVNIVLSEPRVEFAENSESVLNIAGFDMSTLNIIQAFSTGLFS